jgi:uncharacterized membrane protein
MADLSSASITINAPADQVMAVIADFPSYPLWVDSMKSAEVLTSTAGQPDTVRMVLDHSLVKDDYVLAYRWAPTEVTWRLVRGTLLKKMDGAYRLTPTAGGTAVTYSLSVDVALPMIGLFKRKAERTIIDGALSGLKQRVEGRT